MFSEQDNAGATGKFAWLMFLNFNKGKQLLEEQGDKDDDLHDDMVPSNHDRKPHQLFNFLCIHDNVCDHCVFLHYTLLI